MQATTNNKNCKVTEAFGKSFMRYGTICKQVNSNLEGKFVRAYGFSQANQGKLEFEVANSSSERSTNSCEFGANSNSSKFVRIRTCIPNDKSPKAYRVRYDVTGGRKDGR